MIVVPHLILDFSSFATRRPRVRIPSRPPDSKELNLCIPKTPSGGFPSNVTLLLPDRLLNPGSNSLPAFLHVADFKDVRRGWDLRDTQELQKLLVLRRYALRSLWAEEDADRAFLS